jgi:hypothetical protein
MLPDIPILTNFGRWLLTVPVNRIALNFHPRRQHILLRLRHAGGASGQ